MRNIHSSALVNYFSERARSANTRLFTRCQSATALGPVFVSSAALHSCSSVVSLLPSGLKSRQILHVVGSCHQ